MALWSKNVNNASNSTISAPSNVNKTPNTVNRNNLFQNTTPGSFSDGGKPMKMTVGQWGVTANAFLHGSGSAASKITHTGWVLRRAGLGPIISITGDNRRGPYANMTPFTIFGGTANATGFIVTTSNAGLDHFVLNPNNQNALFNKYDNITISNYANGLFNVSVTTGGSGYSNTDYVVTSGGDTNGIINLTTNSTGGITNTTITNAGAGFHNNTSVVYTVYAANGSASLGTGAVFSGNVAFTTAYFTWNIQLGGRGNRESFETLVAAGSFVGAGSPMFPNT